MKELGRFVNVLSVDLVLRERESSAGRLRKLISFLMGLGGVTAIRL